MGGVIKYLINLIYPVGSIYLSIKNVNPGTYLPDTKWVSWGSGRVPVGVSSSDTNFNTVEKTGGESTHKLTIDELASHNHSREQEGRNLMWDVQGLPELGGLSSGSNVMACWNRLTTNTGGDKPHNNLQPYITCYMWKRTA